MRLGLSGDFCANGIVSHRRTGFPHLGGRQAKRSIQLHDKQLVTTMSYIGTQGRQ